MLLTDLHDHGPPLTLSDLAAVESRYNVSLPTDYADHMLRRNGGRPHEYFVATHRACGEEIGAMLSEFFVLGIDGGSPFERFADIFRQSRGDERFAEIVDLTIPVGIDPGGSLFLLGHRGVARGAMYLELHDTSEEESLLLRREALSTRVLRIAESFSDFLERLKPWSP